MLKVIDQFFSDHPFPPKSPIVRRWAIRTAASILVTLLEIYLLGCASREKQERYEAAKSQLDQSVADLERLEKDFP